MSELVDARPGVDRRVLHLTEERMPPEVHEANEVIGSDATKHTGTVAPAHHREPGVSSMTVAARRSSLAAATPGASTWPKVSVVIPTLNEAANLPLVLGSVAREHEVVIVDGHSTDDTVEVARRARPDATILRQRRKGKGDALARGFAAATGDIIVMLDADGSADPAEIPRFVEALLAGADFAKGSRFLPGGGSDDITALRRAGNQVLTTVVNRIFGSQYTDLCYGYNAFWRRCLDELAVCCDGFEVETSINVQVAKLDLRVVEVPSFERDRIHGVSNLNAGRDGLRVLRTILGEWVLPKRSARMADLIDLSEGAETAAPSVVVSLVH